MSDRGIPKSLRHTARLRQPYLLDAQCRERAGLVKFHFRTQQGIANLTDAEAASLVAQDRESQRARLVERDRGG